MHNYVKVEKSTEGHPDGPITMWVKDKHVVLTPEEAAEVATALLAIETPPPVEEPTEPTPPAEPEPDPDGAKVYRGKRGR